jgi:hypothetical protein
MVKIEALMVSFDKEDDSRGNQSEGVDGGNGHGHEEVIRRLCLCTI